MRLDLDFDTEIFVYCSRTFADEIGRELIHKVLLSSSHDGHLD